MICSEYFIVQLTQENINGYRLFFLFFFSPFFNFDSYIHLSWKKLYYDSMIPSTLSHVSLFSFFFFICYFSSCLLCHFTLDAVFALVLSCFCSCVKFHQHFQYSVLCFYFFKSLLSLSILYFFIQLSYYYKLLEIKK